MMAQSAPQGTLILQLVPRPIDANADGVITGGWILGQMDTAASIAAETQAKRQVVISAIKNVQFFAPVHDGDLFTVYTAPDEASEAAIAISVSAWVKRRQSGKQVMIANGQFAFAGEQSLHAKTDAVDTATHNQDPAPQPPEQEEELNVDLQEFAPDMLPALRAHLNTCWHETYADILTDTEMTALTGPLDSANLGGMLMEDSKPTLIITKGDQIIGCVMSASRHNITYIWGLYIQKKYQRIGLGRGLVEAATRRLPEKGMVELTVLKTSEPALKFFTSLGFKNHRNSEFEFVPGKTVTSANMYAKVASLQG
jgi:acyl-CoA thioesterase YciA